MISEKCPACGESFLPEGWVAARCGKCGIGKTISSPGMDYSRYHRDEVYTQEKALFRNIFRKRANIIFKLKTTGRALEVGSSTGILLSLLKEKGWDVLGVEPSREAFLEAKGAGVPTLQATFERAKIQDSYFDLVIFNHTLEHMDDPVEVILKAKRVLKGDGLIFIDVPNFGSLAARFWGERWKYLLPQEHKWHFTPKSLFLLLKKSGFRVIYQETHSGIWGCADPLLEVQQALLGRKKRFFIDILTAIPAFIITKLGFGTGLTVVAKRSD